ncbi:MAG: hypothetical protein KDE46_28530 [Caldilineaceae bacterium]|nr:hypothetical protein [Caldilineaceae bacterium]
MKVNPVINCTLVIRSQMEYSRATQAVSLRCILEMPVTGKRVGFTDVESLLAALRAELANIQNQIIPPGQAE